MGNSDCNSYHYSRLKLIFVCLLSIDCINTGHCILNEQLTSRLAQEVVDKHFSKAHQCITIVTDIESEVMIFHDSNSVIRVQFNDSSEQECDPHLNELLIPSFRALCSRYIVQISRPVCFFPAWFATHRSVGYERLNPIVLFLPSVINDTAYGDDVLSMDETNDSPNILIVEKSNEEEWPFKIYTNNFYQMVFEPGRVNKIYLDEWSPRLGFRINAVLFPNKLIDLKNKTLRVYAVPYLPYSKPHPLDGSEMRIVEAFCQLYNCGFVSVNDDEEYWGTIYVDNMTGTGLVGALLRSEVDIGIGSSTVWLEDFPFIDFSDCYLGGATLVVVPKPELLGGWFTPFLPFAPDLWACVLFTVAAAAFALYCFTRLTIKTIPYLAEKHEKAATFVSYTDAVLRSIGMLVAQQPSGLVIGSPVRHLFTSMEIIYFILTTLYVAELFDYLTIPRTTKPIDTIQDIVEHSITWLGFDDAWVYALRNTGDPIVDKFADLYRAYPAEKIIELAEKGGYGIAVERTPGGNFVYLPFITEKFISLSRVMKGPDIYGMAPITLFLQKGSPYTKGLNRILGMMQNGGLVYKWEADSARKYLNYTIQEGLAQSSKTEKYPPKILSVADLEGAFLIYFLGQIIAAITLIIEMHFKRKDHKKQNSSNKIR